MKETLVICCPGKFIYEHTVQSLLALIYTLYGKWNVYLMTGGRNGIYASRNSILGKPVNPAEPRPFKDLEYDFILWVDNDIEFRPDDFQRLYDRNLDIVSGLYRNTPKTYCAVITKDWDRENYRFIDDWWINTTVLEEVNWVGFGFLLIKQGVFESLGYPWIQQRMIKSGGIDEVGAEDESFGYRIQHETDYKMYIDPEVVLEHHK